MLSETFKKAFSNGGLKAAAIAFISELVLAVIGLVLMGSTIIMPLVRAGLSRYSQDVTSLPVDLISDMMGYLGVFLLFSLVAAVIGVFIGAGLLGSYEDAVAERQVSLRSFWDNAKRFFLGFLGYGLLFGVLFVIVSSIVMFVLAFIPFIGPFLGGIISAILTTAGVVPLVTLSVMQKSERKGFLSDNLKVTVLCGVAVGVLVYIPFIGWLAAAIFQLFYPLYILSLYHEQYDKSIEQTQQQ